MTAGFEVFKAFEQDAKDFADFAKTRLKMPMLVLSSKKASGEFLIDQGRLVDDVEGVILKGSGHWLMDEARSGRVEARRLPQPLSHRRSAEFQSFVGYSVPRRRVPLTGETRNVKNGVPGGTMAEEETSGPGGRSVGHFRSSAEEGRGISSRPTRARSTASPARQAMSPPSSPWLCRCLHLYAAIAGAWPFHDLRSSRRSRCAMRTLPSCSC